MKHVHITAPTSGNLQHATSEEWRTAVGIYNQTQLVLTRYGDEYEFVICDRVDSHPKFWTGTTLDNLENIAKEISGLVSAAKSKEK